MPRYAIATGFNIEPGPSLSGTVTPQEGNTKDRQEPNIARVQMDVIGVKGLLYRTSCLLTNVLTSCSIQRFPRL